MEEELSGEFYLLLRQHMEHSFAIAEVCSLVTTLGFSADSVDLTHFPFAKLPEGITQTDARALGQRCAMVKKVIKICAKGSSLADLIPGIRSRGFRPFANPSFSGTRKNQSFPMEELRESLRDLPESNGIHPQVSVQVQFSDDGWFAFAGQVLATGAVSIMAKYNLKERMFLGPTSLTSEFALIMANLALSQRNSFILDPFVGTGGAVIAAVHFGAQVLGLYSQHNHYIVD